MSSPPQKMCLVVSVNPSTYNTKVYFTQLKVTKNGTHMHVQQKGPCTPSPNSQLEFSHKITEVIKYMCFLLVFIH